jgi:hypothetical protein
VMFALFRGIPVLVILEEPHHGVQFGVQPVFAGFQIDERHADGTQILLGTAPNQVTKPLFAPVRAANTRVLSIASLRRGLFKAQQSDATMPQQTGGASLAVEALNPPWRQRFEGTKDNRGGGGQQSAGFLSSLAVAGRVSQPATKAALQTAIQFEVKP